MQYISVILAVYLAGIAAERYWPVCRQIKLSCLLSMAVMCCLVAAPYRLARIVQELAHWLG